MKYTKAAFGSALLAQLDRSCNPEQLAGWAYGVYLEHVGELEDDSLHEDMMSLVHMDGGPQFYLTEAEIRRLAARLIES